MLQYLTLMIYTWAIMFAQLSVKKVNFKHKVENVRFLPKKWPKTLKTAISRANLWKLWHFVAQLALSLSLTQTWNFQNICRMSRLCLSIMNLLKMHHSALLRILNGRDLDSIQNTRLQRITTKLLGYNFKVQWIPGKKQVIADALS